MAEIASNVQYPTSTGNLPGEDLTVDRDAGQEPSPAALDERLLDSELTPKQFRRVSDVRVPPHRQLSGQWDLSKACRVVTSRRRGTSDRRRSPRRVAPTTVVGGVR